MEAYAKVRQATVELCQALEIEDFCVQPEWYASPPKWHLGHTTWFFETFCLRPFFDTEPFCPAWDRVFNSYYESIGPRVPQAKRGTLSRPTVGDVLVYREQIDERMTEAFSMMEKRSEGDRAKWFAAVELGLNHEQQHQELLAMDIKSLFFHQIDRPLMVPLQIGKPANCEGEPVSEIEAENWWELAPGVHEVGAEKDGFAFDNERPRHRVFSEGAFVRKQLVTNAEYLAFMLDDGYKRPEFWLSSGWEWVQKNSVESPLYWTKYDELWFEFSLSGLRPLELAQPVQHVSYFEAQAFAQWKGHRLPTEAEWEALATRLGSESHSQLWTEGEKLMAVPCATKSIHGSLWQWTQSAYLPHPGYQPFEGAFGEYNGKFMSGQMVLKGGCFATPRTHYRPTYRNFFSPEMRWQFSGIRLAR